MEEIRKFLEWFEKSKWYNDTIGHYIDEKNKNVITVDDLIKIYEKETKKYTVADIFTETVNDFTLEGFDRKTRNELTAFANRYAKLKAEGRIKE